jgi:hypothetical protein
LPLSLQLICYPCQRCKHIARLTHTIASPVAASRGIPLPRAPENVTVCEEPLTDTRMRHVRIMLQEISLSLSKR